MTQVDRNPAGTGRDEDLEALRSTNLRLVEGLQELQRERAGDSMEAVLAAIDRAIDGTLVSVEELRRTRGQLIRGIKSVADRLADIDGPRMAGAIASNGPETKAELAPVQGVSSGAPEPTAEVPAEAVGTQAPVWREATPVRVVAQRVDDAAPAVGGGVVADAGEVTESTASRSTPAVAGAGSAEADDLPAESAAPVTEDGPARTEPDAGSEGTAPDEQAPDGEAPATAEASTEEAGTPLAGQIDLIVHRCATFTLVNKLQTALSELPMVDRIRVRTFRHGSLHLTVSYVGDSLDDALAQIDVDSQALQILNSGAGRIEATFAEEDSV